MQLPDAVHAFTKLQALRKMNHARGQKAKLYERALDDSLTKLAKWADLPEDDPERDKAWETWLLSPLPNW